MTYVEPLLTTFESFLEKTIEQVWASDDTGTYLEALTQQPALLAAEAAKVGDGCLDRLNQPLDGIGTEEVASLYIVDFIWADRLKSFFILWRDILFQQQKAAILLAENKSTQEAVDQLKIQSKNIITQAAGELKTILPTNLANAKIQKKGIDKLLSAWKHQQTPWPIYKMQIEQLVEQCQLLNTQGNDLKALIENFYFIKEMIGQELGWCKKEITTIKNNINNTIDFIENNVEEKTGALPPYLQGLEGQTAVRNHQNEFTDVFDKKLEDLKDKMQVPVSSIGGILQYKDINFNRRSRQWLESEILPLFYEIWELTDNAIYGKKMTLVNVRNRVIMATNESTEDKKPTLDKMAASQPLKVFLSKINNWENSFSELEQLTNKRLEEQFNISNIYNLENEYLPVPLEYTINKFGIGSNEIVAKTKDWINEVTGKVAKIKSSVEQEEILSTSEKVVRYIQSKKGDLDNNQYASIFLTKGYLGESFWIGRENEIRHMEKIIGQWKQGYRGASVLTGSRFCGKSLFGDLIANRFFNNKTIRLFPNTTLKLEGRKIEIGKDLGEALNFIKKYGLNNKWLIWIDDLELWKGENSSLLKNVRQLKKHIDAYSNRLFFMVSMSSWTKVYLNLIIGIDKIFQTEIHLDRMSKEEIRQAILIRHGATHKTLIEENGEEVSPQQFNKLIAKIHTSSAGNIGDALNLWAFSTKKTNDEEVTIESLSNYLLPDFLNADSAILLSTIIMEKRTTEYDLRKIFGPAFTEKYAPILKRLLHVGILSRQLDGSLEINEVAANDTARLLKRKNYIMNNG